MGDLKNAKMYGGIGSILMLVGGFIPLLGFVLPIVGLVLVFVAIKNIADEAKNQDIFKNYLLYFILNIVALVAVFGIAFITLGAVGFSIMDLASQTSTTGTTDPSQIFAGMDIMALISGCLTALAVAWILLIISAIFLRKSFTAIADYTKVGLFGTTGLIYLIGAATLIIAIGGIIILIAFVMQIIAFFSLPDTIAAAEAPA